MHIRMMPRIIGDDGEEIKEGDLVMVKFRKSDTGEAITAQVEDIQMTMLTLTLSDAIGSRKPRMYRVQDILEIKKFIQ